MRLNIGLSQCVVIAAILGIILGFPFSGMKAHSQVACGIRQNAVTEIGERIDDGKPLSPNRQVPINYNDPRSRRKVRYFRALINVENPMIKGWNLTIRDKDSRVIQSFGPGHFKHSSTIWTKRIDGQKSVFFKLETFEPSFDPGITISASILMFTDVKDPYYSVQDINNIQWWKLFPKGSSDMRVLGEVVGFLMTNWKRKNWCCSGVMVAPDLFLTNWHCGGQRKSMSNEEFWSKLICNNTIIDLSWDGDSIDREYVCVDRVAGDKDLDFVLLRVRPLKGDEWARSAIISRKPITQPKDIRIIHHPLCMEKHFGDGCSGFVKEENQTPRFWQGGKIGDFIHRCDTEGGSSGAPVFSGEHLVALHYKGFEKLPNGKCDKLNKALPINAILNKIKEQARDDYNRLILVD